jgi:phage terminase Nu1 subunit (DNA packaging protein)
MEDQVTAHALANMLGVSKKAISELAKRGIIVPVGRGRYALEASVNSYCAYLREVGGRDRENAQPTQTKLKG